MTISSNAIVELLKLRHPVSKGEWITFTELGGKDPDEYRRYKHRSIDFVAISCWPSKGRKVVSYEIKTSRADFMNEINDPTKRRVAEAISTDCYFAMPHGLVKPDEIPEGWGLLSVNKGGLRRSKAAMQRTPKEWDWWFTVKTIRKAYNPWQYSESTVPKFVWSLEGAELSYEKLIELAEYHLRTTVNKEREKCVEELIKGTEVGEELERLRAIEKVIAKHAKLWHRKMSDSDVEILLNRLEHIQEDNRGGKVLTNMKIQALQRAISIIENVVER